MPTSFVLSRDIIFENVPVTSTLRGFAVPFPAVLRTTALGKDNSKDKEWDGRSASFTWNKTTSTPYLAKILHTSKGKAGYTRTFLSVREVSQADWNTARDEWATYLVQNAEDYTSTYKAVIRNLSGRVPRSVLHGARQGLPVTTAPFPQTSVVPPVATSTPVATAPAAPTNNSLPMLTWDPNDEDIAQDLFEVPGDNPNFMPDAELFKILDLSWKRALETNSPVMILIYGDTSTGKTEHPLIWAARRDALHCRIDCGAFGEIYDVTGPIKAKEQNGVSVTEWIKGKTIRAMADPRPAVIQLDEVNRISDVKAMNVLFPFFDSAKRSYFDDNQTWMHLAGAKLVVCTMNGDTRGDDIGEYVGTQPLDQAFISRFPIRRQLRYPDSQKLAQILEARNSGNVAPDVIMTVAEIATELVALNKFVPNLRELFAALDFLKEGVDIFHALKWTVGGIYKDDGTAASDYTSFKAVLIGKGINTDE